MGVGEKLEESSQPADRLQTRNYDGEGVAAGEACVDCSNDSNGESSHEGSVRNG